MANPEHLEILKRGVKAWNEWRREFPDTKPDLRGADLSKGRLRRANFSEADLTEASLIRTDLRGARFARSNLTSANLHFANLTYAELVEANLSDVNLMDANMKGAECHGSNFRRANLGGAILRGANLSKADIGEVILRSTVFGDMDLSDVMGLEVVNHRGPSVIGIDTIYRSHGNIPDSFLRGAGVPQDFIVFMKSLTGQAFDFYSAFISYSTKDQRFADRLHADLQSKGVRCWLATEDLKIGDRFRQRIDESIRLHDKLLLILSEHSVGSAWVEQEMESAFEKEVRHKRDVVFPIRIDDAVMDTDAAWAASIRRTRHIGDFTRWKDHDSYQKAFERLLRDLKAESKAKDTRAGE